MTSTRETSDKTKPDVDGVASPTKEDATGQFHRGKAGSGNDGLVSAEPRIFGSREREASSWNENADETDTKTDRQEKRP